MTENLGTLVVRLLFNDRGFTKKAERAAASYKRLTAIFVGSSASFGTIVEKNFDRAGTSIDKFIDTAGGLRDKLKSPVLRPVFNDKAFIAKVSQTERDYQGVTRRFGITTVALGNIIATAFTTAARQVSRFVAGFARVGSGFQRQIDVVGAIAGSTDEQLQRLATTARELGRETEFTATQTGEALQVLAQAGKTADESIGLLPDTLAFAQAQSAGLAQSTELLISTVNTFTAQQLTAAEASDVFTRATQTTQLSFDRLQESLKFAGPQAAAFNVSLEETVAVLGAFADVGIRGSLAGTAFRQTLAASVTRTDQQAEALERLGLTFDDIDPSANGFIGILENLGEAGVQAEDALAIFGTRAGPAFATLARSAAIANGELRASVEGLANSTGATAEQVERVTDNVVGSFRTLVSRSEDLGIEIFDSFAGPLQDALEVVIPVFDQITEALSEVSGVIELNLGAALKAFTGDATKSGQTIADSFAQVAVEASKIIRGLAPIARVLASLVPLADDLAFAFATAFAASKAAAFARAIATLPALIGTATTAMAAFGTATTFATGGLAALAAAIAVVVTGAIVYIATLGKARTATESLRRAQEAAAATASGLNEELAKDLAPGLRKQQSEGIRLLRTSGDLSDARRREIKQLGELDAAGAAAAEATGRLILTQDGLRTAEGLLIDKGEDAVDLLNTLSDAAGESANALTKQINTLETAIQAFDVGTGPSRVRQVLRDIGEDVDLADAVDLARRRLIELQAERDALAAKSKNTAKSVTDFLSAQADARVEDAQEAETRITASAQDGADDRRKIATASGAAITAAFRRAQADFGGLLLTPVQKIRADTATIITQIENDLTIFQQTFIGAEAERVEIVQTAGDAITLLRVNEGERLRAISEEQTAAITDIARDGAEGVTSFTARNATERVKIARETAEALESLEASGADEREAIIDRFNSDVEADESAAGRIQAAERRRLALERSEQRLADARVAIVEESEARIRRAAAETFKALIAGPGPIQRAFARDFDRLAQEGESAFGRMATGAVDFGKVAGSAFAIFTGGATFGLSTILGLVTEIIAEVQVAEDALTSTQEALADAQEDFNDAVADGNKELSAMRDDLGTEFGIAVSPEIEQAAKKLQEAADEVRAAEAGLREAEERLASGEAAEEAAQKFLDGVLVFVQVFSENIDDIFLALVEKAPEIGFAIVKGIGLAIVGLVEVFVEFFKEVFRTALQAVVPKFLRAEGGSAREGGRAGQGRGLFRKGGVFDKIEAVLTAPSRAIFEPGKFFGGGNRSAAGGLPFVPTTATTLVHAGEGILTREENRERLLGTRGRASNRASPAGDVNMVDTRPNRGGMGVVEVRIGGRDFDRFLIEEEDAGGLPLSTKSARGKTGSRVGFKRI